VTNAEFSKEHSVVHSSASSSTDVGSAVITGAAVVMSMPSGNSVAQIANAEPRSAATVTLTSAKHSEQVEPEADKTAQKHESPRHVAAAELRSEQKLEHMIEMFGSCGIRGRRRGCEWTNSCFSTCTMNFPTAWRESARDNSRGNQRRAIAMDGNERNI
jgi:hypothetical protein